MSADPPSTLADTIRSWAHRQPSAPAVTVPGAVEHRITYGELDERTSRVANVLAGLGLAPGALVAHLGRNSIDFVALLYGASKARCGVVGLNWRLAGGELAAVLEECRPAAVLVDLEFVALLAEAMPDDLRPQLLVAGPDAPVDERSSAVPVGARSFTDAVAAADPTDPATSPGPGDVAVVFSTSGTTGTPKAVVLDAERLDHAIRRPNTWKDMTPESVNLVVSPVFHMAGATWVGLTGSVGAHLVLMRTAAPADIVAAIARYSVTGALLVPALIRALVDDPAVAELDGDGAAGVDVSSLELIAYGAAPIDPTLLRRALEVFGCSFVQVYGLTETGGATTNLSPEDHLGDPARLASAGRPLPGIEMRVVDTGGGTGAELPAGEVGEIQVRSDQSMVGYLNRPQETAAALTADGWVRTGDAGYLDADGYLFLTDRISDMIVSGGENVYPLEVENVLTAHPGVADAAVVGAPDDRWGERVHAVVVARPGASLSEGEVMDWCRDRLAHYKCPRSVAFADDLPRTAGGGKVVRRELRAALWPQGRSIG